MSRRSSWLVVVASAAILVTLATAHAGKYGREASAARRPGIVSRIIGRPVVRGLAALGTVCLLASGCAVTRGQESVGSYIDDTTITTSVKSKLVADKTVDASAISVETLNGEVQLSGFAKSSAEKAQAEALARQAKGVKGVKNSIVVRS